MWLLSCPEMSSLSSVSSHFRCDVRTPIELSRIVDDFELLQYVKTQIFSVQNIDSLMRYGQLWPSLLHTKLQCNVKLFLPIPLTRLTWTQASEGPNRYSVISKGSSIILLLVYCSYLYFQVCVSLQSGKLIKVTTPHSPGLFLLKRLVATS